MTVSIAYLPVVGGEIQVAEAWRIELDGDLGQLTAGDASNLALLLGAAAGEVVATGQLPASDRDQRWMRRMRGRNPGYRRAAQTSTWVLGTARSVAGQGAGRPPGP